MASAAIPHTYQETNLHLFAEQGERKATAALAFLSTTEVLFILRK